MTEPSEATAADRDPEVELKVTEGLDASGDVTADSVIRGRTGSIHVPDGPTDGLPLPPAPPPPPPPPPPPS